jgi:hypothetical protein
MSEDQKNPLPNNNETDELLGKMFAEAIEKLIEAEGEVNFPKEVPPEGDEDRIECPFCGKLQYPGTRTAETTEWSWDNDCVCEHLLFLAIDISVYSGFQYRSKLFNRHLEVDDCDSGEIEIPFYDNPDEFLSVPQIIEILDFPRLLLRDYDDPEGGTITFGFVPGKANE